MELEECCSTSICGRKWKRKEPNISWPVDLAPSSETARSGTRVVGLLHVGGMAKLTPAHQINTLNNLNLEQRKMTAGYVILLYNA